MGNKPTYPTDRPMTPEKNAVFTCLHVVAVAYDFPGGPSSIAAGFRHLVNFVTLVAVAQSEIQNGGEVNISLQTPGGRSQSKVLVLVDWLGSVDRTRLQYRILRKTVLKRCEDHGVA